MTPVLRRPMRNAFTLLELLVVIGIITLLAAILVPVMSQVRMRAFSVQTQGEMQRLMTACQAYFHDFNAYPGPLSEAMIYTSTTPPTVPSKLSSDLGAPRISAAFDGAKITSSENLALGLIGLLTPSSAFGGAVVYCPPPPRHDVVSLNYTRPASYHYLDFLPDELPTPSGPGGTDYYANATSDSVVPEFMDHIPTAMAILYLRAVPGATLIATADGKDPSGGSGRAAYSYSQLAPYGFTTANATDFQVPTNATAPPTGGGAELPAFWTYFMNPGILNEPRGKNAFILIDAGPDRVYGTKDDIIVTP